LKELIFDNDHVRLSSFEKRYQDAQRMRSDNDITKAALTIQKAFRAYNQRKKVKDLLESQLVRKGYYFGKILLSLV